MASIFVDGATGEVTLGPDPIPGEFSFTTEQLQAFRAAAYRDEADPLFFKWQAGEGTKEDWEAKREEIRSRYPYPADGV